MTQSTHAPYAIMGDFVLAYAKTTKAACGKRIVTSKLVKRGEQTCEECTQAISRDHSEMDSIEEVARELGYTGPSWRS